LHVRANSLQFIASDLETYFSSTFLFANPIS
jgi:hypothetical protein